MSRPLVIVTVVAAMALVALAVSRFDLEQPGPLVNRAPLKPLAEPVRDTSAPAVASRERSAGEAARPAAPKAPRAPVAPLPEAPAEHAAVATATLHISSDVPGAQVFIDRKFIGTAPVTAADITPGSHQINVSAPGHEGVAETHDVTAGSRDIMISLKTIRLDQSIPVKHKHGMGSCSGRLVATPDGLRYETDNTKDGFSAPLSGLETFTVDFLAKNLKVKVRGGRSYDFTDPDGKAEPLYLFHQAVEKVRVKQVSK